MARGINKVILVGNLGDDPETKTTAGGMTVAKVRLATTSVRKNRDGDTVERTEWHRVTFFGKAAEVIDEYARKGQQLYVEGSIRYDKYTDGQGVERYSTDILSDEFQFLGGGKREEREERGERPARQETRREREVPQTEPAAKSSSFQDDFADDDIPF